MIDNHIEYLYCPLCNSEKIKKVNAYKYFNNLKYSNSNISLLNKSFLFKCENCNSNFSNCIISEEDSIKLYTEGESDIRWKGSNFENDKHLLIINELQKYLTPNITILDIGCSNGSLLDFAKKYGLKTYGIEYSNSARSECEKKEHIMLNSIDEYNGKFDIITLFDVVEHIYDFPKYINKVIEKLSKGGVLIILTGNSNSLDAKIYKSNWWYYNFPEHIIFPSKKYYQNFIHKTTFVNYLKVYNAKNYQVKGIKWIHKTLYYFKIYNYFSGLPSLAPDHHLVVLKKNE